VRTIATQPEDWHMMQPFFPIAEPAPSTPEPNPVRA
jgi:hypothetical protein